MTLLPPTPAEPAVVMAARQRHAAALRSYVLDLLQAERGRADAVLDATWRALARAADVGARPVDPVALFAEARRRAMAVPRAAPLSDDPGENETGGTDEAGPAGRFRRLTPKQHEVVRLKFAHGFTNAEIARIVDVGELPTVRRLHHALARLAPAFRRAGAVVTEPDDPRLTLAALGELEPASWQAWSAAHGEAATNERIEEVRRAAGWLREHFASAEPEPSRTERRRRAWVPWLSGVALVAAGGVLWLVRDPAPAAVAPRTIAHEGGPGEVAVLRVAARREAAEADAETDAQPEADSRGVFRGAGEVSLAASAVDAGAPTAASTDGGTAAEFSRARAVPAVEPEETEPTAAARLAAAGTRGRPAQWRGEHGAVSDAMRAAEKTGRASAATPVVGGAASKVAADSRESRATAPEPLPVERSAPERARRGRAEAGSSPGGAPASPGSAAEREPAREGADIAPVVALKRALESGRWPRAEDVSRGALLDQLTKPPSHARGAAAFGLDDEATTVPWLPGKIVVRMAATAREAPMQPRWPARVVLVLDASGSMVAPNRWPLVMAAVDGLLDRLQPADEVAVVTYAAESRVLRPLGPVGGRAALRRELVAVEPAGLTNGGAGLAEAFALARGAGVRPGGSVVILCTDGGFNVGQTGEAELGALVARHAAEGIRLATFGFGRTDRIDPRLAQLARVGGGGAGFVNTRAEAVSVMFRQLGGLIDIAAEDVELAVEAEGGPGGRVAVAAALPGETVAEIVTVEPGRGVTARLSRRGAEPRDFAWDGWVAEAGEVSEEFRFELAAGRLAELLAGTPAAASGGFDELERWTRMNLGPHGGYRDELLELIAQARGAARAGAR